MARRRQPEPVAEASRGMQSKAGWLQPRQRGPQRQGIVRGGLGDEANSAIDIFRSPSEAAECGLVISHHHQPLDTVD